MASITPQLQKDYDQKICREITAHEQEVNGLDAELEAVRTNHLEEVGELKSLLSRVEPEGDQKIGRQTIEFQATDRKNGIRPRN